jgi:prepilin-type N-terminal cleavage/methylation domain-containing protein/prepilin-type processing-associated H-X9-DG protein
MKLQKAKFECCSRPLRGWNVCSVINGQPIQGRRSRLQGVTMLELLIVMAIIAVLAGILIPTVERVKLAARSNQCAGKLREIGIGLSNYFVDHGTTFPTMVAARESKDQDNPAIDTVLLPYVKDEYLFECPGDHEGIFQKTGSSYLWNSLINGQRMGNMNLLGLTEMESGIPTVSDKENFHKHVGDGVNILYADGHVTRSLQLIVGQN